jgi:hypothetical protein
VQTYHILYAPPGLDGAAAYTRKLLIKKLRLVNESKGSVLPISWGRYKNWLPANDYPLNTFLTNLQYKLNVADTPISDVFIDGPGVLSRVKFFNNLPDNRLDIKRYFLVPAEYQDEPLVDTIARSTVAKEQTHIYRQVSSNITAEPRVSAAFNDLIAGYYSYISTMTLNFKPFKNFALLEDDLQPIDYNPVRTYVNIHPVKLAVR